MHTTQWCIHTLTHASNKHIYTHAIAYTRAYRGTRRRTYTLHNIYTHIHTHARTHTHTHAHTRICTHLSAAPVHKGVVSRSGSCLVGGRAVDGSVFIKNASSPLHRSVNVLACILSCFPFLLPRLTLWRFEKRIKQRAIKLEQRHPSVAYLSFSFSFPFLIFLLSSPALKT